MSTRGRVARVLLAAFAFGVDELGDPLPSDASFGCNSRNGARAGICAGMEVSGQDPREMTSLQLKNQREVDVAGVRGRLERQHNNRFAEILRERRGLEPATSGVTGRYELNRYSRLPR
jgi:hypothetical protein